MNLSVMLLLACGLILRIYTATDLFLHPWDERYHALVARNLMDHPLVPTLYDEPLLEFNYKNWAANHVWLHKQPFPLWSMSLSMHLFGVNEIALRLPSVVLSTLGIWLTFVIARYLFGNRVAFISAFLYSIHGLIIELTAGRVATDHIDLFFLVFIQLALYFTIKYIRKQREMHNLLAGICTGLAILSKWLPALIVLPIWVLLVVDSRKFSRGRILGGFMLLTAAAAAIAVPWQIYIHQAYPLEAAWEKQMRIHHMTEVLDQRGGPWYYHLNNLRIIYGELVYLPVLWFSWYAVKGMKHLKRASVFIWFAVPYLFFSLARTKMQAYTIISAPSIFIMTALFWHYLSIYRNRFRQRWIACMILLLLILLPVRYAIERIKPFDRRDRNPPWARELRMLGKELEHPSRVVVFNTDRPIETMFYAGCTAYRKLPDAETLGRLTDRGYLVRIWVEGELLHAGSDGGVSDRN